MTIATTYSHAAPYIREGILNAASTKLGTKTQRDRRYYSGVMHGLTHALDIMLSSPEGQDSPIGYPEFRGSRGSYEEVERFVGGAHRMADLGFTSKQNTETP